MKFSSAKTYLLSKPESEETFPFGSDAHVFKLKGKVFAILFDNEDGGRVNLKCDPDHALALRDIFAGVAPGYHMNKKHWNTVSLESDVADGEIERLSDHSYALILKKLPKVTQKYMATHYSSDKLREDA